MRGAFAAVETLVCLLLALAQTSIAAELDIAGPPMAPLASSLPENLEQVAAFPVAYGVFQFDPKIEKRVNFWVGIYARYHSWETVIHDVKHPYLVYSALDTRGKGKDAVSTEKARVLTLLKKVNTKRNLILEGKLSKEKLHPEEKKIYEVFENAGMLTELPDAANGKRIRGQAGLRDALEDALFVSGRYLPRMEKVFENFGLPPEIAYLPFVESGFNKRAVSKVGASGIWQFMPYTGKLYLRVDEEVDERNDPMRAAEAAARLMRQNFSVLGVWPLAITAYNHGTAGMARAMKDVGSTEISEIIARYESKTFGFASQNFYSSFLAAMHVAKNSEKFLGVVPRAKKLEFDEFVVPDFIDAHLLLEKTEIDEATFRELNPALTEEVYSGRRYIPVGYTIRVPVEARVNFFARYEAIPQSLKFKEQKRPSILVDANTMPATAAGN